MSAAGELLSAAKDLLLKGRTKGAEARDADGNAVDPTDPTAERFSLHGALKRAAWDRRDSTGVDTALVLLNASSVQDPHLNGFSAHASDEDLTKRFDDAIGRADGKPAEPKKRDERLGFDPLSGGGEERQFENVQQPQSYPEGDDRAQHDAERVRAGLDEESGTR